MKPWELYIPLSEWRPNTEREVRIKDTDFLFYGVVCKPQMIHANARRRRSMSYPLALPVIFDDTRSFYIHNEW